MVDLNFYCKKYKSYGIRLTACWCIFEMYCAKQCNQIYLYTDIYIKHNLNNIASYDINVFTPIYGLFNEHHHVNPKVAMINWKRAIVYLKVLIVLWPNKTFVCPVLFWPVQINITVHSVNPKVAMIKWKRVKIYNLWPKK